MGVRRSGGREEGGTEAGRDTRREGDTYKRSQGTSKYKPTRGKCEKKSM